LLLTATPLEDDAHGFFRLVQLLRPEDFPEDVGFEERLASGVPLPPCTSATRRVDIGGLPPRVGVPVTPDAGWQPRLDLIDALRRTNVRDVIARRRKVDRIRRALASGAALNAVLGVEERDLRRQAIATDDRDPRLLWLLSQAPRWRDAGEKTLVFVAHRETLEMLRKALSDRAQVTTGMFHEELPVGRRDIEVARFRQPDGPSLLVSTECGGEGRNFEFCRRLVLFDLPWAPSVVEQRIGRLDRIGRRIPVEVVYFHPPGGIGADVARLFEALGLFREPLAGVEPQLAPIEHALEEIAVDPDAVLSPEHVDALVADTQAARSRIREAAYQQLHRDPYRPEMAGDILGRIPPDLDALIERVVVSACERFGFTIEHPRGRNVFAIEVGHESLVESLPGVPAGAAFVGTFSREHAVEDETLDFFASGHALVEGVLAHFDDSAIGRVAHLEIAVGQEREEGIVAIYRDGASFDILAFDSTGHRRLEWETAFREHPLRARRIDSARTASQEWRAMIRRIGAQLDRSHRPYALAAIATTPVT
jgi:ATP-dependent helicase HepA